MTGLYKQRLLSRFLALGVLILCLSLLSSNGTSRPLASPEVLQPQLIQTQAPTVTVQTQTDAPLLISSPRVLSWSGQDGELAFELLNVSGKPIRAYAIKQEVISGSAQSSSVLFSNLDLTSSPLLESNQSLTTFDTCQAISEKQNKITLFVDYVEFADGTKWGADSAKFADVAAGQRAAAYIISKRLLKILNTGSPLDVISALETGAANIDPPVGRSEAWKEGFRSGSNSIAAQLKNAKNRESLSQVERKLRQLAERFKGAN